MPFLTLIFWSSGFLLFYAYVGYPIVLWVLSAFSYRRQLEAETFHKPTVTLLISAYNEQSVIKAKIQNSLALDYPRHLLEIIVISDGSTDGTDDIVADYANHGVQLRRFEGRIGKTACLNNAVPLAKGEVIVFSDANSQYDKDALWRLMRRLVDHRVGFVSGRTTYRASNVNTASISLYSKLEVLTKILESRIGSCIGADGAIFAIRKDLFRPLRSSDINDFVIPLSIIERGFQGKLASDAFCVEAAAGSIKDEFKRQVRITTRTIRAIFSYSNLFNPLKYGLISFELLSHKLFKLLGPLFLLLLFVTSLALTATEPLYSVACTAQVFFYLMAGLYHSHISLPGLSKIMSPAHTFTMVNIAILMGWIQYFRGETYMSWSPSQREGHKPG